jgi:mRNA interferase MazF
MRRGEIWTVAGGAAYAGKPRPAVILQADVFGGTDSVVVCPFTSDPTPAPSFRIPIEPTGANGLRAPCTLMIDKLTAVPRARLRRRLGVLADDALLRLGRVLVTFLGIAGSVGR